MKQVGPNRPSTPCFSVREQRLILYGGLDGPEGLGRCLMRLSLFSGIHPVVLSDPERFRLEIGPEYYSWSRAKNSQKIIGPWSEAFLHDGVLDVLRSNLGASIQWYGQCAYMAEQAAGLPYREPFQIGRRTCFVNLARLGVDPFTITNMTGTSLKTIGKFYAVGARDRRKLSEDDHSWLTWLMGV